MNYKQLYEKIKVYNAQKRTRKGDEEYFTIVKMLQNSNSLADISEDKARFVFDWLNKWKCRIPSSNHNVKQLMQVLRKSANSFRELNNCKLHSLNNGDIEKAKKIFEKICTTKVGRRMIASTATSKIMHIVNPNLFMMLDKQIRESYGCFDNSEGYFNFMLRMSLMAREIIKSYCIEHNVSEEAAELAICSLCHDDRRTMAKIIDEYNYTVYTLKK